MKKYLSYFNYDNSCHRSHKINIEVMNFGCCRKESAPVIFWIALQVQRNKFKIG